MKEKQNETKQNGTRCNGADQHCRRILKLHPMQALVHPGNIQNKPLVMRMIINCIAHSIKKRLFLKGNKLFFTIFHTIIDIQALLQAIKCKFDLSLYVEWVIICRN